MINTNLSKLNIIVICIVSIMLILCILLSSLLISSGIAKADTNTALDFNSNLNLDPSLGVDFYMTSFVGALYDQNYYNVREEYDTFDEKYDYETDYRDINFSDFNTLVIDGSMLNEAWEWFTYGSSGLDIYLLNPTFFIDNALGCRMQIRLFATSATTFSIKIWLLVRENNVSTTVSGLSYDFNIADLSSKRIYLRIPRLYTYNDFDIIDLDSIDRFSYYNKVDSQRIFSACVSWASDLTLPNDYEKQNLKDFENYARLRSLYNYNNLSYYYDLGREEGYLYGYDDGKDVGIGEGFNTGVDFGDQQGYQRGYNKGYEDGGLYNSTGGLTFKNLIFGVIDAPFKVFRESFNFEIFGINMSAFVLFVVSGLLIGFVIKKMI